MLTIMGFAETHPKVCERCQKIRQWLSTYAYEIFGFIFIANYIVSGDDSVLSWTCTQIVNLIL